MSTQAWRSNGCELREKPPNRSFKRSLFTPLASKREPCHTRITKMKIRGNAKAKMLHNSQCGCSSVPWHQVMRGQLSEEVERAARILRT